jgi:hypothetical protein
MNGWLRLAGFGVAPIDLPLAHDAPRGPRWFAVYRRATSSGGIIGLNRRTLRYLLEH